jgi:hypothetical protein
MNSGGYRGKKMQLGILKINILFPNCNIIENKPGGQQKQAEK